MTEESRAVELLRQRILICAGASLAVAMLPSMILQIKATVPEAPLRVMLTPKAVKIMPATALAAITDAPVLWDWPPAQDGSLAHIELATWAQLIVVMPATADLIGKAAHGIADDLVTTCLLAATCPILFVPSMNEQMWANPIVQSNVSRLRAFGRHVIEPEVGWQASTASFGVGAIPPLRDLLRKILMISAQLEGRS
jgi:phosphopantothenoylcysteine synthetase/decarboxylase